MGIVLNEPFLQGIILQPVSVMEKDSWYTIKRIALRFYQNDLEERESTPPGKYHSSQSKVRVRRIEVRHTDLHLQNGGGGSPDWEKDNEWALKAQLWLLMKHRREAAPDCNWRLRCIDAWEQARSDVWHVIRMEVIIRGRISTSYNFTTRRLDILKWPGPKDIEGTIDLNNFRDELQDLRRRDPNPRDAKWNQEGRSPSTDPVVHANRGHQNSGGHVDSYDEKPPFMSNNFPAQPAMYPPSDNQCLNADQLPPSLIQQRFLGNRMDRLMEITRDSRSPEQPPVLNNSRSKCSMRHATRNFFKGLRQLSVKPSNYQDEYGENLHGRKARQRQRSLDMEHILSLSDMESRTVPQNQNLLAQHPPIQQGCPYHPYQQPYQPQAHHQPLQPQQPHYATDDRYDHEDDDNSALHDPLHRTKTPKKGVLKRSRRYDGKRPQYDDNDYENGYHDEDNYNDHDNNHIPTYRSSNRRGHSRRPSHYYDFDDEDAWRDHENMNDIMADDRYLDRDLDLRGRRRDGGQSPRRSHSTRSPRKSWRYDS